MDISKFKKWLRDRGSEINAPTNPYEILRFTTPNGIGLIYKNKSGRVSSMNAAAQTAVEAFNTSGSWRVGFATKRIYISPQRKALIARDGDKCIYCECIFNHEVQPRIEHVVPVTAGGPNHLSNLALSCESCDKLVGTMSAAEKIKFAISATLECRAKRSLPQ